MCRYGKVDKVVGSMKEYCDVKALMEGEGMVKESNRGNIEATTPYAYTCCIV